jgi:hypothetical protein
MLTFINFLEVNRNTLYLTEVITAPVYIPVFYEYTQVLPILFLKNIRK